MNTLMVSHSLMNKDEIKEHICSKLELNFGVTAETATKEQFYRAAVMIVHDLLIESRRKYEAKVRHQEAKTVYYMCMEFLIGRSLRNNLYNLGMEQEFEAAINDLGYSITYLYDLEPDAGLGNGGLGRLATCFLDSCATLGYPVNGYSIQYEFGIFKQKIIDGWQTELPDFWLNGGDVWMTPRFDEAVDVSFDGMIKEDWSNGEHHIECINCNTVMAIPYDMMISGYQNTSVSRLRLWKATNSSLDMGLFNKGDYLRAGEEKAMAEVISKVLYPSDNHPEGKSLRLRQQYFLVSASVQDIVRKHLKNYGSIDSLSDKVGIHINETHPALAIPELMRILLDEHKYSWEAAWDTITRIFAYTNHTIMSEALEIWPEDILRQRLPRIDQIVHEINHRFCNYLYETAHLDLNQIAKMAVVNNGQIHMANLCLCTCYKVNGVSQIHSDIIKANLFRNYSSIFPSKFTNVTNGFNYRRWLCQANPRLCSFICELIGDKFTSDPEELRGLLNYDHNPEVLNTLAQIKKQNKIRLAHFIKDATDIAVDTDSIFDLQVKRLHEYKRQLLNALHILHLYEELKENPNMNFHPKTFIFGAKAAPGYYMAKRIIRLICCLANEINSDKAVADKLKIVFLEDYRVTLAELMMPAAEISEQISLAGTEASGTGNMKLMINGAITLGTLDGANVEISEAVGEDNILIFGLHKNEVEAMKQSGYSSSNYYQHINIKKIVERLICGISGVSFQDIASSLIGGVSCDPYMVLADFDSYCNIHAKADQRYRDPMQWNKMSLVNIACAGRFAADRAVEEYATKIWNIDRI